MRHQFVSPHPDDVALSCGGLIASLRAAGDKVVIVTVFSGAGDGTTLTPYQREALGFEWHADMSTAHAAMQARREEDRSFAEAVGAAIVHLDLPDAVFRGYEGDAALFGSLHRDDPSPADIVSHEVAASAPDRIYLPLAVGNHVDHQQIRKAGVAIATRLVGAAQPAPATVVFYEDVPYCYRLPIAEVDAAAVSIQSTLAPGLVLACEFADVADTIERKIDLVGAYASQLDRLFGGFEPMAACLREGARRTGGLCGLPAAERYWRVVIRRGSKA